MSDFKQIYSEQIISVNDKVYILKDTIKFFTDEQRNELMKSLGEKGIVYLQRPNDNKFYIVEEIPHAEYVDVQPTQPTINIISTEVSA